MEASNEFRRREPTLLAIFAAKGPTAIEFRCGDAAMTEKSYQPSRESGECRLYPSEREERRRKGFHEKRRAWRNLRVCWLTYVQGATRDNVRNQDGNMGAEHSGRRGTLCPLYRHITG